MKTEQYQIIYMSITNTLVDAMSRLVELKPEMYQDPYPEGQEYGYCM